MIFGWSSFVSEAFSAGLGTATFAGVAFVGVVSVVLGSSTGVAVVSVMVVVSSVVVAEVLAALAAAVVVVRGLRLVTMDFLP